MFSEDDSSVTASSTLTPAVQQQLSAVKNWVKDLSALKNFTFVDFVHVLDQKQRQGVRSQESEVFQIAHGLFILQR